MYTVEKGAWVRSLPVSGGWLTGCYHAGRSEEETGSLPSCLRFWWGRETVEAETATKGMGTG